MKYRLLVSAAWSLLGLPATALATHGPDDEDQLEALLKREVQGPSRYAQSLMDAPAAVSVIGRRESDALGHQTLGDMLAQLLPSYALPALWAVVDEIPLTRNGKVDERSLIAAATPAAHRGGRP